MEKRWTADWPESSSLELSNEVQIGTTGDVGHNGGDGDEQEDDDGDGDEEEEEEKEDSDGDDASTDTECSAT